MRLQSSILIPRLFPHPFQFDSSLGSDFDRCSFRCCHCLFDTLHQILSIPHQHLCSFNILLSSCNKNLNLEYQASCLQSNVVTYALFGAKAPKNMNCFIKVSVLAKLSSFVTFLWSLSLNIVCYCSSPI